MVNNTKKRWQIAYDSQDDLDTLEGGVRQFNGYRHPRTYALLQSSIQQATRHWQNRDVLDAGCGSGDTGSFLKAKNRVMGMDFSHQMLKHARNVYQNVALADVEHLPVKNASFDGVLAVGLWQCLAPDTPFLKEVARILRPNGEAVFGWVLNGDYLLYRKGLTFRLDPSVRLSLLTQQNIPSLLDKAGLQVLEIFPVVFPIGVFKMKTTPRWLQPLVPAYTVRCKIR